MLVQNSCKTNKKNDQHTLNEHYNSHKQGVNTITKCLKFSVRVLYFEQENTVLGTPAPNSIDAVKQRCGEFLVEQAYINGQFVSTGKTFVVDDPSCDQSRVQNLFIERSK